MAISTKGRRKIIVQDKWYLWYLASDDDYEDRLVLHILSADKELNLSHPLRHSVQYVVSKGKRFQNLKSCGTWERYLLPFNTVFPVTPKFVSAIILWATTGEMADKITWDYKDGSENGIWL